MRSEYEKKKRVLVYGMSDNPGGIETYLLNLVRQSEEKNIAWDFVTDFPEIAYKRELEEAGCRIYYIPAKSRGLIKQWRALADLLRKHPEYQTVYFNILNAGAAFTMAVPWIYRRKIIVHSHNGSADSTRLHHLCRPVLNFMAKKFVACSAQAGEFMFGKNKNVLLLPNAIDVQKYEYDPEIRKRVRAELQLEGKIVFCHVGRLVYQKNPKGLIDLFDLCRKENDRSILLSVGTGDMEEETKAYVSKKGLQDSVRFLGVRKDVHEIMQAADIFLLPSIYEGLPIVAVEAQAADLPCFLSDTISRETRLLPDRVKFLPLDDFQLWKKEIFNMDEKKRRSRKQELILAGYDLYHQEKNLEKLIQEIEE